MAIWTIQTGDAPLVAAAIHDGHDLRDEVAERIALTAEQRLREEDPFTRRLTEVAPNRVVGLHSRFEVDLNRPRNGAVYVEPEDAWGLDIWTESPPGTLVRRSLTGYDAFYERVGELLDDLVARYGYFVVYDLHSYNHRREGPEAEPAEPEGNPEINVGTGTMDRERWGPVVDAFVETMRAADVLDHALDVRENVRFTGGYFPEWIHENYPETGCAIAVEFKKTFMDEWTGELYERHLDALYEALTSTVDPVLEAVEAAARAV